MEIIKHPIKPEKGKTWHLYAHPYFTKQASNVVSEYIKNYTKEGDTVLDPFCGTGVTAIEALVLKRKAIVLDINPLACFITEQTILKVDVNKMKKYYVQISDELREIIEDIDNCDEKKINNTKIPYWYPQGIKMPLNADFNFVEELWTKRQLIALSILFKRINEISEEGIRNQFKLAFSAMLSTVNLTYMPSEKEGKTVGGGGPSIFGTYRYWKPTEQRELPVWEYFDRRIKLLIKAKEEWNNLTKDYDVNENFKIINGSVLDLDKYVKDEVDYIYTDPPYGANITYLDLSVMWNGWLGFKVTNKMRKDEVIEGGDLDKTQEDYEKLLSQSFEEMGNVLRKGKWMSLVFAHKKLEFWNLIIDSCETNGLEFKGSTYQPTNNSSVHYKKNPANVLCSQRIANFQKTFKKSKIEKTDDLAYYILNEIERSCVELRGATIDKIYQRVLDKLLDNRDMIYQAKKKGYTNLEKFLEDTDMFVFEPASGLYFVKDKEKHVSHEEEYFKFKDEIRIYLQSMLKSKKAMTIDQIHKELFELYRGQKKFPLHEKDIEEILNDVARKSSKGGKWILNESEQVGIGFASIAADKLIKINTDGLSHSEVIYRLYLIGRYLKFNSWIGKREQDVAEFMGNKFSNISIKQFPEFKAELNKAQLDNIKQIDLIWFDKFNNPRYAFEIEESTGIITAFERFANLLKADNQIAGKLFVVLPKNRQRTWENKLKTSRYIGEPIYLNTKMGFVFKEDLKIFYDEHVGKDFDEQDMRVMFSDIEL